jgi:hypothetical protein
MFVGNGGHASRTWYPLENMSTYLFDQIQIPGEKVWGKAWYSVGGNNFLVPACMEIWWLPL